MIVIETKDHLAFCLRSEFFEVSVVHDLCHDESFLKVRVNPPGCLRGLSSFLQNPDPENQSIGNRELWCVCSMKDYLGEGERQLSSRHPDPPIYIKHILKPITTQKRLRALTPLRPQTTEKSYKLEFNPSKKILTRI